MFDVILTVWRLLGPASARSLQTGVGWHSKVSFAFVFGVLSVVLVGCDGSSPKNRSSTQDETPPVRKAAATAKQTATATFHEAMKRYNPDYNSQQVGMEVSEEGEISALEFDRAGVVDLEALRGLPLSLLSLRGNPVSNLAPLKGMPLREVYLEETKVKDLSPLAGAPIRTLWLNESPIEDLSPLKTMPLTSLNLLKTPVIDISSLAGLPLQTLWLNETQVVDLSPLSQSPLVSLTLYRVPATDLGPVARIPSLQRLHLGESNIGDLSALGPLRLKRLIVTPKKISKGWETIRGIHTLEELDVEFIEGKKLMSPVDFWQKFDAGML